MYKKIESDEIFLNAIKKIQKPIEVDYKYLLLNGDNITLNAVDIPDSVVSFRRSMTTLFDKYLVPIRARDNILHMTIARIKKIPKNDTLENNLTEFIKELRNIRHEVSRKPIKTLTSEVFVGTNMIDIPEYPEE